MTTLGKGVPDESAVEAPRHFRQQSILLAEKLVDSPRLDAGVDPALTPVGKDREVLIRFVMIDLLVAGAVAGAALLGQTWLLAPLMAVLFISLALIYGMFNQLLSDPVG